MTEHSYADLLNAWGVSFAMEDSSCPMDGSPERSALRTVVLDQEGGRWILEQIAPDNITRKQQVAEHLQALCGAGLPQIHPWQRTQDNSFFQCLKKNSVPSCNEFQCLDLSSESSERKCFLYSQKEAERQKQMGGGSSLRQGFGGQADCWMLRPYVDGVPLNRKTYLNDEWRIDAMARFLIQLRTHTNGWSGPVFSITDYAENRMTEWRKHYSKLAEKLETSFGTLQKKFFPVHDRLPCAFCHGDYHPLNMVWGEGEIRSVIDWEFCGIKPELYDVALLLGCIGFEDPDHLIKPPAIKLIHCLRSAGFCSQDSWDHLLDLMAVIRYGWMSEWIRRSDREARRMEAVYIDILVDQKDYILQHW